MSSVPGSATSRAGDPAGAGALPERLRGVVAKHLKISPEVLRPETQLGRDLCIDSLAAAELLVTIEDELHIQLLSEVLADRDEATYGDLEKIVQERIDATG